MAVQGYQNGLLMAAVAQEVEWDILESQDWG